MGKIQPQPSLYVHLMVNMGMLWMLYKDWNRGLGAANGWWVSFLHSAHSAYHFRLQKPPNISSLVGRGSTMKKRRRADFYWSMDPESTAAHAFYIVLVCAVLKFGGGFIVSHFLGLQPVLFKSYRHFFSFALALALAQASPSDFWTKTIQSDSEHGLLSRLILNCACALYKIRKLTFIVISGFSGERRSFLSSLLLPLNSLPFFGGLRILSPTSHGGARRCNFGSSQGLKA